jgi:hypothetical protein
VVVDDDRRHLNLGRGQIRIIESFNESTMVFGTESLREKLLTAPRRKKNNGISEVEDRHSTAAIKPPAMAY